MRDIPIVCKFGGTSLADASRFLQVRSIIRADPRRRYIVVSAPGKRFPEDIKVTDRLIGAYAAEGQARDDALRDVRDVFEGIARGLKLRSYAPELASLPEAAAVGRDMSASRGEWLCAMMLAELIGLPFVDSKDIFLFDNGVLDERETYARIRNLPAAGAVVPGFYGSDAQGRIATFPRGGSDICGAHVAAALKARAYENWTDVDGFYAADPRLVDDSPVIESMSYRQARAFSRLGAGVLHHDSIAPVERLAIPIYIKNTFKPSAPGTRISPFAHSHLPFLAMTKCAAGMCRLTLIGADARCADAVTSHMPPEAAVTRAGDTIAIVCPEYHAKAAARAAFEVCWRIARRA